jgi:ABC-2 type transport system permease protein
MRPKTRTDLVNIAAVARREFVVRATTRTYAISTLILVMAAAAVALAPVGIGYFNRDSTRVAVYVGAADLRGDPVATLDALLNPPASQREGDRSGGKTYSVSRVTDRAAALEQVRGGKLNALLDVERDGGGEAVFTVYTTDRATSGTAVISRQAATSIAVADRLGRLGLSPSTQASLFVAPQVTVRSPDAAKAATSPDATPEEETRVLVVAGLEMFLLLALVLYGNWVAQSVVEEKSSRMMEIILATASPFQLLAGKVLGVSAAALLQFLAMLAAAAAMLVLQDRIASAVLGDAAGLGVPTGLTPALILTFAVFFVLGFLLYSVLFAAAASLVSRQEDVSQIVLPMTLLACAGYMIATYASIGFLDGDAPWIVALSWVPFLSPYMMLSRLSAGTVGPAEVTLAALLLIATIVAAVWAASRIYSAGVLMYGQKPSLAGMWKAVRDAP